ncbi:MAG: ORF6N domain-containing protein [Zoogloeaceae bacterium]|jgi:hypothetical protein|nr:ORF6N domain-containing protein [Zoogloeaceae bacterium]
MSEPSLQEIELAILTLRGQRVMLSGDLAELYGVEPRTLMQAVKRNIDRFPADFMFQMEAEEWSALMPDDLKSQFVISNSRAGNSMPTDLRSQIVTSNEKPKRGGARYAPYAFTEQGIAMLSSVLRSPQAVQVNIEIMRAFVRLRRILNEHQELARRIDDLEGRYDQQFRSVFEAIRQLMTPPTPPQNPIGFTAEIPPKSGKETP